MNTKQELIRTERAKRNLALKVLLEKPFLPKVKSYFNAVLKDFKTLYIATGQVLSKESYSDDTVSLLKNQYRRVSRVFGDEMRISAMNKQITISFLTKQGTEKEEVEDLIAAALILFENRAAKQRGAVIDDTTDKEIRESTAEATQTLQDEGRSLTTLSIATMASSLLKKKFNARTNTISMTETQFSVEKVKAIEAGVISEGRNANISSIVDGKPVPFRDSLKQWASVLIESTRDHHARADGQIVKMDIPFIVGNELLMHPLDSSLGASKSNVINCLCSALYTVF